MTCLVQCATMAHTFGAEILAYRRRHRVNQRGLAEGLGVPRNVVSRWERGEDFPRAPNFKIAVDFMQVPTKRVEAIVTPTGESRRGSFGHLLRVHRYAAGLTSRALADLIDVQPMTISRWEREGYIPNSVNLPRLSEALGWDLDELLAACPMSSHGGSRSSLTRAEWERLAEDVREEAARGPGTHRRLEERWGVTGGSVNERLRVLRVAGYIVDLRAMRST